MTESSVAEAAEQTFNSLPDDDTSAPVAGSDAANAVPSDGTVAEKGRKRSSNSDGGVRSLQAATGVARLDLLSNVEMEVTAELGRTRMTVRELLSLTPGMVVELDKVAGSPIDMFVNGTLIAHGEVVVIDEEFGIRISEIVGPATETAR
jgi:flagellar motor switch protein FliN/FliY